MTKLCHLCLRQPAIKRSHIFPEFMYKGHYDEKHCMFSIPTSPREHTATVHKGIYDELLCPSCETTLSIYENYFRTLLFEHAPRLIDRGPFYESQGVDYSKVKLLQLSVIWRASVSSRPEFRQVNLGPHEECIRKMLLAKDFGPSTLYPCVLSMLLNDGVNPLGFTLTPIMRKQGGHTLYSFVAVGFCWLYSISSHPPSRGFCQMAVDEQGRLPLYKKESTFFLKRIAPLLKQQGKL